MFDLADPYKGADHVIGGTWAHHLSFIDSEHTLGNPQHDRIGFWGRLPEDYPVKVGHCVVHRYSHHWVRFEVVSFYRREEMPAPELIPADTFFGMFMVSHIWTLDGTLVWERRTEGMLTRLGAWFMHSVTKRKQSKESSS
jgi:hypothetical protein